MRCSLCNNRLYAEELYSEPPTCNKCNRIIGDVSEFNYEKAFEDECKKHINLDFYNECWD